MRNIMMAAVAAATLGSAALAAAPAQAQTEPASDLVRAIQAGDVKAEYVQYRYGPGGGYYGPRGYYGSRGYYGGRPYYGSRYGYYPRGYYRRDRGDALAAGALGLATGAIIGGAIAQSQAQAAPTYAVPGGSAAAYCAQRYRSYDPASGTYLGYDGVRRSCP